MFPHGKIDLKDFRSNHDAEVACATLTAIAGSNSVVTSERLTMVGGIPSRALPAVGRRDAISQVHGRRLLFFSAVVFRLWKVKVDKTYTCMYVTYMYAYTTHESIF